LADGLEELWARKEPTDLNPDHEPVGEEEGKGGAGEQSRGERDDERRSSRALLRCCRALCGGRREPQDRCSVQQVADVDIDSALWQPNGHAHLATQRRLAADSAARPSAT